MKKKVFIILGYILFTIVPTIPFYLPLIKCLNFKKEDLMIYAIIFAILWVNGGIVFFYTRLRKENKKLRDDIDILIKNSTIHQIVTGIRGRNLYMAISEKVPMTYEQFRSKEKEELERTLDIRFKDIPHKDFKEIINSLYPE